MASAGDVQEITVLKSQPDSDKALELLRKIASKVKPIMKAHGWILPTLAEFFPKNPNLLGININRGKKICIRLRPASDPYSFLGLEEELIGTMLHELTHNHRGPHDDIFFKYLDSLWVEYDALVSKGYQGEGFLGVGNRVGVGVSHDGNLSLRDAREKALKTFEEKERMRKLLGTGGALGGRPAETKGRRMGDVLADAAERRLKARKACGGDDDHSHPSGSTQQDLPPEIQQEIERAEKDSKSYIIDLTQDDSDDEQEFGQEEVVTKKGKGKGRVKVEREESPDLIIVSSSTTSTSSTSNPKPSTSRSKPLKRPPPSPAPALAATSKQGWICPLCTFQNPSLHLSCTICLSERPTPPVSTKKKKLDDSRKEKRQEEKDDSWLCHVCAREMEGCWWTCRDCGTMKLTS